LGAFNPRVDDHKSFSKLGPERGITNCAKSSSGGAKIGEGVGCSR